MKETKKHRSIPANAIILPMEIMLTILLILIVILVYEVNRSSNRLSELTERAGVLQQEITDLHAGINTLTETASTFIQNPVAPDGSTIAGPLSAYAEELGRDRRGPAIAERFRRYEVSAGVQSYVDDAAAVSEEMMAEQLHAIALVSSVYPLPPIPALAAIPLPALFPEEETMPPEARIGAARKMILGQDYAQKRYAINEDVSNCTRAFQSDFSHDAAATKQHLGILRAALWVVIAAIAVALIFAFTILRLWVVSPLRMHSGEISSDKNMRNVSGMREMAVLVNAYNTLLDRRNKLEAILRSAAETDALTGLPNRYSMERYTLEAGEDDSAMAVLMFDVNYLKQVNDTEGHLAGDKLLRTAGDCIRECFATESGDNCYRLGGDEFAAVLRGCDENEIKKRIDRFSLAQEREKISVSVGYGYAAKADEGTFRALLNEADARMYEMKKQTHGSGLNAPRDPEPNDLAESAGEEDGGK